MNAETKSVVTTFRKSLLKLIMGALHIFFHTSISEEIGKKRSIIIKEKKYLTMPVTKSLHSRLVNCELGQEQWSVVGEEVEGGE